MLRPVLSDCAYNSCHLNKIGNLTNKLFPDSDIFNLIICIKRPPTAQCDIREQYETEINFTLKNEIIISICDKDNKLSTNMDGTEFRYLCVEICIIEQTKSYWSSSINRHRRQHLVFSDVWNSKLKFKMRFCQTTKLPTQMQDFKYKSL